MRKQPRKYATAVQALVDPGTGRTLGWIYQWDNGETSQMSVQDLPLGLFGRGVERPLPTRRQPLSASGVEQGVRRPIGHNL